MDAAENTAFAISPFAIISTYVEGWVGLVLGLAAAGAAAGVMLTVWRRSERPEVRVAALTSGALLIAPHAAAYDAGVLAIPAAAFFIVRWPYLRTFVGACLVLGFVAIPGQPFSALLIPTLIAFGVTASLHFRQDPSSPLAGQ